MMMSKMRSLFILAYDRMRINVSTLTEKKSMKLLNVSYVSDFMINIVADSILENKEMHFSTKHRHLYRKETQISFVLVSKVGAHYVLEDNRSEEMSIFVVIVQKTKSLSSSESALMLTSSDTSKAKFVKITIIAVTTSSEIKAKFVRITSVAESTFSATSTSKKSIFWTEIVSRSIVSSKSSRLSISSSKSISRALENASLTLSSTSSQKSAQLRSKHQNTPSQKSAQMRPKHQKPYLTLDDLHRMFAGKPKPIGLQSEECALSKAQGIREAYWARTYFDKGNIRRGGRIQPIRGLLGRIEVKHQG